MSLETNDDLEPKAGSLQELCVCGKRRGLHRYGTEACPHPNWRPGCGGPEWSTGFTFTPAARPHWRPT
jgi:hypothetical protein